jgi:hypothetical protein
MTVAITQKINIMREYLAAVTLSVFLAASTAQAQHSSNLNNSGFFCFNQQAADCFYRTFSQYVIVNPGDYWRLTMTGTGLGQVTDLKYSLAVANAATQPLSFDVMLNDITVSSGVVAMGAGMISDHLSFAPVYASGTDDFTFQFRLKSYGAMFVYRESSIIEITGKQISEVPPLVAPEPSTYALMAAGLSGLGVVARRRRRSLVV